MWRVREFPDGLVIRNLIAGPLRTNTYVISWPDSESVIIVDPGPQSCGEIVKQLKGFRGVVVTLLTHGHFDHASDVNCLRRSLSASHFTCMMHEADVRIFPDSRATAAWFGVEWEDPVVDEYLKLWESSQTIGVLEELGIKLVAIHTPGHTLGSMTYYLPNASTALTGDTLFKGNIGRTDFPGGDPGLMVESLRRLVNELPQNTLILPGHGPETTIADELRSSKALRKALEGRI